MNRESNRPCNREFTKVIHSFRVTLLASAVLSCLAMTRVASSATVICTWGNATYVDLSVGETIDLHGRSVTLRSCRNAECDVDVDGVVAHLVMARQCSPTNVGKLRLFLADTRAVAELTRDNFVDNHALMQGDAILCVSPSDLPLLPTESYVFPIDLSDGYAWTGEEDSHMFAYLSPTRSHEGIDLNMTGAQESRLHPVVAIEDGKVVWVADGRSPQKCVLLQSERNPEIFYIYQHLFGDRVLVEAGERLQRGQTIGPIWGDGRWEHLHFTVICCDEPPSYDTRYRNVVNVFPQLRELYHGSPIADAEPVSSDTSFVFADPYYLHGNRQCLSLYSDLLGYGWRLGEWSTTKKVQANLDQTSTEATAKRSALVRKVMHAEAAAPETMSNPWIDFEVKCDPGSYVVRAKCGNGHTATNQRLEFEGSDAGAYVLGVDQWAWTEAKYITVRDGLLTVRLHTTGNEYASIKELTIQPAK